MNGVDDWLSVARTAAPDDLREWILSGYKSGKPFTPYVPTIAIPAPVARLLDFGCGLGRNFPYEKTIARHITGFDLPPMIERCRAIGTEPVDCLLDDWAEASAQRFDLVVASLVLQHIEPAACRAYLADFARMAPVTYLLTRGHSDFGTNVLDAVADTGLFDAGECVEVEHDPGTHQLRVIGRTGLDQARRAAGTGHYEVLLRSKAAAAPRR